jgi:hypothetical protein
VPTAAESRLSGKWLLAARCTWLLLAASLLTNTVSGVPAYYAEQTTVCRTNLAQCAFNGQPIVATLRALHQLGVSLSMYAGISTAFQVAVVLVFLAVGALIFWRKSNTWQGFLTSLFLLIGAGIANNIPTVLITSGPLLLPYVLVLIVLAFVTVIGSALFLLTFPTGHFAPRWTRILVVLWVAFFTSFIIRGSNNASHWPGVLFAAELLVTLGSTMAVQIYRYRRIYTPLQRQQTKWVVFGVAVAFLIEVTYTVIGSVVPGLSAPDSPYQLLGNFTGLAFVAIPLTVGIAILRYQLWDIDVIINRVLVYGLLTALLAALYAGLIIGLESLTGFVGGSAAQQPVALVISTLVIAGLFLPVRRRIQSVIDRRFYRRKYDAQKMLDTFSDTLRQEVDLLQLREQVLAVVQETVQPEQVWLWLRESHGQPQNLAPAVAPVGQRRTTSSQDNQSGFVQ